jgi:hypothetical protein
MRYPSLKDIPNMAETTDSMKLIFEHYKIKKAIFIGHRLVYFSNIQLNSLIFLLL